MDSNKYRVNEQFNTVQGEGVHVGIPSSFIRLQICTVGCPWCDTKYTWAKGGRLMTVEQILKKVEFKHVVITGGEPTNWNLDELILALRARDSYIQLETSGQNDFKGTRYPDWITWSPKANLNFKASKSVLTNVAEVKFVVDESLTLEQVWDCLAPVFEHHKEYTSWPNIVMMPEGCPPLEDSMAKALQFTQTISELTTRPVRMVDRLQYRLGVK